MDRFELFSTNQKELEQLKAAGKVETSTSELIRINIRIEALGAQQEEFARYVRGFETTLTQTEIKSDSQLQAQEALLRGDISGARQLLVSDAARLEAKNQEIERQISEQRQNQQIIANHLLLTAQATAADFSLAGRFEEAVSYFEKSINCLPSFDNLSSYATFLQDHNQYRKAIGPYNRLLGEFGDDLTTENKALILNDLGVSFVKQNDFKNAEIKFTEALNIKKELAKNDHDAQMPLIAGMLSNLGALYQDQNDLKQAEESYTEAIAILRDLEQRQPGVYLSQLAMTLGNLGKLYRRKGPEGEDGAKSAYQESLEIYRGLSQKDPRQFLAPLACLLKALGNLHLIMNEQKLAEERIGESLEIYRNLVRENPYAYRPDLAGAFDGMGSFYAERDEFVLAEKNYYEALKIFKELHSENPQDYQSDVAALFNNLAVLHQQKPELFEEAEKEYTQSLTLYIELAKENPDVYNPFVGTALSNLARFYSRSKVDEKKSIMRACQAMAVLLPFYESAPWTVEHYSRACGVLREWNISDDEIRRKVAELMDGEENPEPSAPEQT